MRLVLSFWAWVALVIGVGVYAMLRGAGGAFGPDAIGWMGAMVVAILYPLPIAIAAARAHPRVVAIALGSLALGWTGVGWLVALFWAFGSTETQTERRDSLRAR